MLYAFARDSGLLASELFATVHPSGIPLYGLYLSFAMTIVLDCIFLVSSTAFNAISAASVVALSISYSPPLAINCGRGRIDLPKNGIVLPSYIAWPISVIGLCYAAVTSYSFLFPPKLPVSVHNMNYTVTALSLVLAISYITWVVHGHEKYRGPAFLRYKRLQNEESN